MKTRWQLRQGNSNVRPYFVKSTLARLSLLVARPIFIPAMMRRPPLVDSKRPNRATAKKAVILAVGRTASGKALSLTIVAATRPMRWKMRALKALWSIRNPETVSTDYDTSDRLYFEPLTQEDVLEILGREQENGSLAGVIVQFGGQTR